ncbi:hypothetical protein GCM10022380_25870 [Amycolatopsis tucumanensis]|uniref:Uncharacterized protein n=1 Tax=Amycolatopsis tucumanensis TaxID=401106 RepID=A0ABP7I212_9PSEU
MGSAYFRKTVGNGPRATAGSKVKPSARASVARVPTNSARRSFDSGGGIKPGGA